MHFEIEIMSPELTKYHIKGMPFDAVLHHFTGVDHDDPHDHPFGFTSTIVKGSYIEHHYLILEGEFMGKTITHRKQGHTFHVSADTIHRITELPDGDCWTLILPEQCERKPGFYRFGAEILHRFWDETEFKPYKTQ